MSAEPQSTGAVIDGALRRLGVTHLFTLNGGHIWPILQSAADAGIRLIDVRDERTAAFAAEGWSKMTRTCGVAAVTAGPGVTNTVSAIGQARANDSPMLVLGGRAPKATWGMGALQEMDHLPVMRSLTKVARTIETPDEASAAITEAIGNALTPRTGPVFVDIPADVLFSPSPLVGEGRGGGRNSSPLVGERRGGGSELERAIDLIRQAERPAAIVGGGVWWAHAEDALRRFLEQAHVPALLNGMARGMLPPDHPLFRSHARGMMLEQADLLFVIGADLDFRFGFGAGLAADVRIVYVDVDDARVHRRGAVELFGDIGEALTMLSQASVPPRDTWLSATAAAEEKGRGEDRRLACTDSTPIHPARLVAEVADFCGEDAIIVGDGGDFVSFAGRLIHRKQPGLWLDAGPFGCLGSGLGYGMAAKLAYPDRQVVVLAGDGAFGFCAMDFDTLVRHRIPLIYVVGNNGILALEKHPMEQMLGASIAADLNPAARYDKVVQALGAYGELVERPEEIKPALQRAVASGMPACLDVRIDPNARYPRRASLL